MSSIKIKAKSISEKMDENFTKIKIGGVAEIIHGDEVIRCKNKWTRYFMSSIIVFIANDFTYLGKLNMRYEIACGMSYKLTSRIGTNESVATTPDMTDLVSKIDIAPNSITRRLIKEPDYTLYIAEFVFTWDAGTLPNIYIGGEVDGKVGEFGVYLWLDDDSWTTGLLNPARGSYEYVQDYAVYEIPLGGATQLLASRIASADGAFDPFEFYGSIDPLTFKWRFQVAIV